MRTREQGSSLISVMIGLVIASITTMIVYSSMMTGTKVRQTIRHEQNLMDIRDYISQSISCEETRSAANACNQDQGISLLNSTKAIVETSGTTFAGRYLVRATCRNGEMLVGYKDTKRPRSGWVDLFAEVPLHCQMGEEYVSQ